MAIAVTDTMTGEIKHDPRFVDWKFIVYKGEGGTLSSDQVGGLHACTEEDYSKFYEPRKDAKKHFSGFKEKKAFMCMDETDNEGKPINKNIYGDSSNFR